MKARVETVERFPRGAVLLPPHQPIRLFAAVCPAAEPGAWRVGQVADGEAVARAFLESYHSGPFDREPHGFLCPVQWRLLGQPADEEPAAGEEDIELDPEHLDLTGDPGPAPDPLPDTDEEDLRLAD